MVLGIVTRPTTRTRQHARPLVESGFGFDLVQSLRWARVSACQGPTRGLVAPTSKRRDNIASTCEWRMPGTGANR